jgi:hypothetical protein
MRITNSDHSTVIHIKLCRTTQPLLCQAEEGGRVQCGEDGGERRPLGYATKDRDRVMSVTIDPDGGGAVREEVVDPRADGGRVAEETEEVGQAVTSKVVEKPLDIKEDNGRGFPGGDGGPSSVCEAHSGICGTIVVPRPKLSQREDVEGIRSIQEAAGHDPLKEFAAAFKEGDGSVGRGRGVVGLVRLRQRDHRGVFPGVDAKGDGRIKEVDEVMGCHPKCPFDQFIGEAAWAQRRQVRRLSQCSGDLIRCDRGERAGGKGGQVVREGIRDRVSGRRKELGCKGIVEVPW